MKHIKVMEEYEERNKREKDKGNARAPYNVLLCKDTVQSVLDHTDAKRERQPERLRRR